MTNLIWTGLSLVAQHGRRDFLRKVKQANAVQASFLRSLIRAHQHTALGRDLGLSQIQTVDQFRERVPIHPYSAFEPYVERVAKGEARVMTAEPVSYLNLTSGSTGRQKLIPVTARSRQTLAKANRASMGFAVDAAQRNNRPLGKMLLTSSSNSLGVTEAGIPYGPISTSHLRNTNPFYQQVFTHPFEALRIGDMRSRHYVCLMFALANPHLRVIGANFPVLALRMVDYLEEFADELIWDIEHGTLPVWLTLEPQLRRTLETQWQANPQRAAILRQILKAEGRLTPQRVWADLSFIITARAGTSDFYFERFSEYFGNTPIFGGTYASAEATFGIHRDFNTDSTILAIESGFFEFIPEDQWDVPQPRTLLPSEVKPGHFYRIVVTNYAGFYRYDIGDIVEVEGFYGEAPLITFRHRRGGMLSSTTEKTTEFHVTQTMQQLQHEFDIKLENFCITLAPDRTPPHYLVNIELAPGYRLRDPQQFIAAFDRVLKDVHVSYEVKRRDQVPPPHLRILAPGSFANVRQQFIDRGVPETQLKFPHINEDRQFLTGLTVLQEVPLAAEAIAI